MELPNLSVIYELYHSHNHINTMNNIKIQYLNNNANYLLFNRWNWSNRSQINISAFTQCFRQFPRILTVNIGSLVSALRPPNHITLKLYFRAGQMLG